MVRCAVQWKPQAISGRFCRAVLEETLQENPPFRWMISEQPLNRGCSIATFARGYLNLERLLSGWWFGCHQFYFSHDYWECHHPNWRTHIFQRGGPTTYQLLSLVCSIRVICFHVLIWDDFLNGSFFLGWVETCWNRQSRHVIGPIHGPFRNIQELSTQSGAYIDDISDTQTIFCVECKWW